MQIKKSVSCSLVILSIFLSLSPVMAESQQSLPTLIARADKVFAHGNSQLAFELYNQAFRLEPDDAEVNFKLGQAAVAVKDFETAVMAFERVLFVNPDNLQAKIEMAKSFYYLGSEETARQYFSEVLEADIPDEARAAISSFLAEMN